MNTREYGDQLEEYVVDLAKMVGIDINTTSNSGATNRIDSDLSHEQFQIECKRKEKLSVRVAEWKRVKAQARMRNKKPVLVSSGDEMDQAVVTIRLVDFLDLILDSKG